MAVTDSTPKDAVFEALSNATIENGYTFQGWTDEQIAHDLVAYCSYLEDYEPEDLIPYIELWRLKQ